MKTLRLAAWTLLATVCLIGVFPDFFSPYTPSRQYRDLPYAAPGRYHGASPQWLVHGEPYRWLGVVPASLRLMAVPGPGRIFVLGTDEFGRDWYSRLCHGASVSLLLAPAAALLSLLFAVALGGWAGYQGGWIDALVMRASEVFVVLPWFYVVVALRAALPLTLSSTATMFTVFALLATLGCATPARLFRGLVLSLKTGEFVIAARAAGARGPYIFRGHLLPFVLPAAWTQFLVSVPAYIVTEVTLSFLGLGVAEPTPTWGGMLVPLQQYVVLTSYPWMFAPAVAVVVVCMALQIVAQPSRQPRAAVTIPV
jgi:peptide/nickel transport system permease protein